MSTSPDRFPSENDLLIGTSPNHTCWICEKPLPNAPIGLYATKGPKTYLFLLCGPACGEAALRDISSSNIEGRLLDAGAVEEILQREGRFATHLGARMIGENMAVVRLAPNPTLIAEVLSRLRKRPN